VVVVVILVVIVQQQQQLQQHPTTTTTSSPRDTADPGQPNEEALPYQISAAIALSPRLK